VYAQQQPINRLLLESLFAGRIYHYMTLFTGCFSDMAQSLQYSI
jgi:hypothetical protein